MLLNPFNTNNSNIANIKTKHLYTMTNITNRISKFKPMKKKLMVTNYKFSTVITFSSINSFA